VRFIQTEELQALLVVISFSVSRHRPGRPVEAGERSTTIS